MPIVVVVDIVDISHLDYQTNIALMLATRGPVIHFRHLVAMMSGPR